MCLLRVSEEQLLPIVEIIAGEAVTSFDVNVKDVLRGHRGYGGEKVIPTFRFLTRTGKRGMAKAFVKYDPGEREAYHCRQLDKHQVPVPRLYGELTSSDGRRMLFLEYLQPTTDLTPFADFMEDRERFPRFLTVAARLNALRPSKEYNAALENVAKYCSSEWPRNVMTIVEQLWDRSCGGDLGRKLQKVCSTSRDMLPDLARIAKRLPQLIQSMEKGVAHNDFWPDSVAWRRPDNEACLVDLETVGFSPRFTDIARWIGPPDDICRRCFPQRELAELYLDEYVRCGGERVPVVQFLEEVRVLWITQLFDMLWFSLHRALDGRVDWTDDRAEGRRVYRADLYNEVKALLAVGVE